MPNYQGVWSLTVQMQNVSDWPTFVFTNSRALFAGGESSSGTFSDVIDYIDITSTGNATDFGDLSSVKKAPSSVSSATRAVFGGGSTTNGGGYINVLEYVTIASVGNVTDFGDLSVTCQ